MFQGADPEFQVIGGVLKKFRLVNRGANILGVLGAKILGVFCVKNQGFMQKNHIFFQL